MAGASIPNAAHWDLRGAVRSMRSEIAERNLARSDWEPARFLNFVLFDENGRVLQLDQRGAEDSIFRQTYVYDSNGRLLECRSGSAGGPVTHVRSWRYDMRGRPTDMLNSSDGVETASERNSYDDRGSRTKVQVVDPHFHTGNVAFGVEGSEFTYGAPGAATITTKFDEDERSSEVEFRDDAGTVVCRVVFTRDGDGRVVTEEAFQNAAAMFPRADMGPDREKMMALMSHVFGSIRTTNEYDSEGRLVRRGQEMGTLGGTVTTLTYNDHGDVIEKSAVSRTARCASTPMGNPSRRRTWYARRTAASRTNTTRKATGRPESCPRELPATYSRRAILNGERLSIGGSEDPPYTNTS